MQYFGKPNFHKQRTAGLKKTIESLKERIREHEQKIMYPEQFYPEWDRFDKRQKDGYKKHWKREIINFTSQLEEATKELASRGDDHE